MSKRFLSRSTARSWVSVKAVLSWSAARSGVSVIAVLSWSAARSGVSVKAVLSWSAARSGVSVKAVLSRSAARSGVSVKAVLSWSAAKSGVSVKAVPLVVGSEVRGQCQSCSSRGRQRGQGSVSKRFLSRSTARVYTGGKLPNVPFHFSPRRAVTTIFTKTNQRWTTLKVDMSCLDTLFVPSY